MKEQPEVFQVLGFTFYQVGRQAWKSSVLAHGRYAIIRTARKVGGFSASLRKAKGGQYKAKGTGSTMEAALTSLLESNALYHSNKAQEHLNLFTALQSITQHNRSAPGDCPSAA